MSHWLLWERIQSHAAASPDRPAYIEVGSGRSLSYAELVAGVKSVAAGLPPGSPDSSDSRVMIQSGNTIEFPVRFLGHLLRGRAVFPASPDTPAAERERAEAKTSAVRAGEGALLLCSSGTTGLPKIVLRSRASLDAVARAMADAIGLGPADRVIAAVPLVHSYGIEHGLLSPLWAGATVMLCEGLNIAQVGRALEQGATVFPAVPSMIELLGKTMSPAAHTSQALRRVYTAGAPLPESVAEAFERVFHVAVGQVYGLTEVGSVLYRDPATDAPSTVGRPAAGVSVRIVSLIDPPIAPPNDPLIDPLNDPLIGGGDEGEVWIAAPSMLADYVGEPLELIDGHFRTGDLGRLLPTGELQLTGRIRLLIDVGGAKVNPMEVEQVLMRFPGVAAAVVLPLHLSETVRKVRAVVVPADPASPPDVEALRRFARTELAAYKVPRTIELRDSLPRSPTGKVLRHQLETA